MHESARNAGAAAAAEWLVSSCGAADAIRAHDWSSTSLGPRETWPAELRAAVAIVVESAVPMAVAWGPELLLLYNEAYAEWLGPRHPAALGRPARESWPEAWSDMEAPLARLLRGGGPAAVQDQPLAVRRNGRLTRAWFSVAYTPIRAANGAVAGVLVTRVETTGRVLSERRLAALAELRSALLSAEGEGLAAAVERALAPHAEDLPVVLVYEIDEGAGAAALIAHVGAAAGTAASPRRIVLSDEGAAWPLARALREEGLVHLRGLAFPPGSGWPEAVGEAAVLCLEIEEGRAAGLLVVGLPPERELDEPGRDFLRLVSRSLAAALAGARRRATERALAEAELRARAFDVLEQGEPCCVLDASFRFVFVNRGQEAISRAPRDLTLGRVLWEVFPATADPRLPFWGEYHRAMRERVAVQFEAHYEPLGTWFDVRAYPLADGGLVVFFHDAGERKRAEEERLLLLAREREAAAAARRSHAQLLAVFEAVQDGVTVFGMDGSVLLVNEAEARINGFASAEEMKGSLDRFARLYQLRPPGGEPLPVAEWPVSRVLRGESVSDWELEGQRLDTGRQWLFSFSGGPVKDDEGRQVLAVVITRDLTDSRRAVREGEQRFRHLADAMPQLAWSARPDGTVDYYNDRAREFSGFEQRPDGTWTWEPVLHPEDLARTREAWAAALRTGATYEVEHRVQRRDGRYRWYLSRAVPARDAAGDILRWYGTATDIHDQKEAEDALRAADRSKNEFLAMLSHELRNPLAPIRNSLYVLDHAPAQADQARRAKAVIDRQVQHLTRLVDDLLDVTRISRGKIRVEKEPLDLAALVRRACEDQRAGFARAGVALELDLPREAVPVQGDATRLAQAVGNVLQNAAKFTSRGGRASVRLQAAAGQAELRVRDTGAGIATEALARIFEPFVQAEGTLDRSRGGLGLGLALARRLVELHGGTIEAHSEGPGRGASFVLRVPLDDRAPSPLRSAPSSWRPEAARRVLVIEDNVDAAESLREALEIGAHEVAVAYTGTEGVRRAREFRPQVVLCDIGLPELDGYGVARALRGDPELAGTRLVALSGYGLPEDVERARDAGFDRHMVKPPDVAELERLLSALPGDGETA